MKKYRQRRDCMAMKGVKRNPDRHSDSRTLIAKIAPGENELNNGLASVIKPDVMPKNVSNPSVAFKMASAQTWFFKGVLYSAAIIFHLRICRDKIDF